MLFQEKDGGADKIIEVVRMLKAIKISKAVGMIEVVRIRQLGHKRGKMLGK